MIIGIFETGEVSIYKDINHVLEVWGKYPTDILSEAIIFYDGDGAFMEPTAKYAPRKWLKFLKKIKSIEFQKNTNFDINDSLAYILNFETTKLEKNNYFSSLNELREKYPYENKNTIQGN